ncbi:MAG: hypothetical protein KDB22_07465 [Planctomycetales bacterium]|nr:hypothetical protein [Planctomycetales bacterium]
MANDLEKFLQQAAERLANKLDEARRPAPAAKKNKPPVRQQERSAGQGKPRPASQPMRPSGEVVDAVVLDPNPRELGPDPLSNIDTRPGLAREIDQADERMAKFIHDELDHKVTSVRDASAALQDGNSSGVRSSVKKRQRDVSPLIAMLRQPATLRAAFIASEIFQRKF